MYAPAAEIGVKGLSGVRLTQVEDTLIKKNKGYAIYAQFVPRWRFPGSNLVRPRSTQKLPKHLRLYDTPRLHRNSTRLELSD